MRRVLVVDDAAFMRMLIRRVLEANHYQVVAEAENGRVGLMKYQEFHPDIVTLDITMSEMDGIEALKAIRLYDPKAQVIMVSAMGQESFVREAITNGAKSFIVKPFKAEQVISAFRLATNKREEQSG